MRVAAVAGRRASRRRRCSEGRSAWAWEKLRERKRAAAWSAWRARRRRLLHRYIGKLCSIHRRQADVAAQPVVTWKKGRARPFRRDFYAAAGFPAQGCGMRHAGRARRHMADEEQNHQNRDDLLLRAAGMRAVADVRQLVEMVFSPATSEDPPLPAATLLQYHSGPRRRRPLSSVEEERGNRTPVRRSPTKTRQATK